jgi:putative redox protein
MRCNITKYETEFQGERNADPPQYYKNMDIMIHIAGEGITPQKLDRAISLSQNKYCSVYHSLRKDIDVKISYEIE